MPQPTINLLITRLADLRDPEHTLHLLPHRHTSYRSLAILLVAAIFLLYTGTL